MVCTEQFELPHCMTSAPRQYDASLAQALVLDELLDLSLYRALQGLFAHDADLHWTVSELIETETRLLAFWRKFFGVKGDTLDVGRRVKLHVITLACRIFGVTAAHLALEAIEVYGVRKYLTLWKSY